MNAGDRPVRGLVRRIGRLSILVTLSCVHEYRPPSPNEPHAALTAEIVVLAPPGPACGSVVKVNGRDLEGAPTPDDCARSYVTDIAVGSAEVAFVARYWGQEGVEYIPRAPGTYAPSSVPHYVVRADCDEQVPIVAEAGDEFRVSLIVRGDGACAIRCVRKTADGSVPCGL